MIRLKIKFMGFGAEPNEGWWLLINKNKVKTVANVMDEIREKYPALPQGLGLFLDGLQLPPHETVNIINENELLVVKPDGDFSPKNKSKAGPSVNPSSPKKAPRRVTKAKARTGPQKPRVTPVVKTPRKDLMDRDNGGKQAKGKGRPPSKPKAATPLKRSLVDEDQETNSEKKRPKKIIKVKAGFGPDSKQPVTDRTPIVLLKPMGFSSKAMEIDCDSREPEESNCDMREPARCTKLLPVEKEVGLQLTAKRLNPKSRRTLLNDACSQCDKHRLESKGRSTRSRSYLNYDDIDAMPDAGSVVAFKMMHIPPGACYPQISDFKIGKVLKVDSEMGMVQIELEDCLVLPPLGSKLRKVKVISLEWDSIYLPKLVSTE